MIPQIILLAPISYLCCIIFGVVWFMLIKNVDNRIWTVLLFPISVPIWWIFFEDISCDETEVTHGNAGPAPVKSLPELRSCEPYVWMSE